MVAVRALAESDLPEAQRIIRDAFGTFLGVPELETFRFPPYAHTRFGAEHIASFAAERDGALLGSNFAINWGSVGFFGPLSIRPDLWDAGIGQRLVAAACDAFEGWGIRHAGLFTFAQSAKHVGLYGKFGFHPRFLTAIMTKPAWLTETRLKWSGYSALPEGQHAEAEIATRELTETFGKRPAGVEKQSLQELSDQFERAAGFYLGTPGAFMWIKAIAFAVALPYLPRA